MSKHADISWPEIMDSGRNLPSLPSVALKIIHLANNPDATVAESVALFHQDPAVASKLLRAVNSAVYAKPRQVESLNQAVVIMGLNASLSLALSFNLVQNMRPGSKQGLHYESYWRKSLLSAISARILGEIVGVAHQEELFLAALLQDIGMLVLDRYDPGFYADCAEMLADQDRLVAYERERIGQDHAYLGALMLRKWELPERTVLSVLHSHEMGDIAEHGNYRHFVGCIAVSARLSDLFLGPDKYRHYQALLQHAHRYLDLGEKQIHEVIEQVVGLIPETESLFETRLLDESQASRLIQQARDLMHQKVAGVTREISAA